MNFWTKIGDLGVLIPAAIYVYIRHSDKPPLRRLTIVVVSAALAVKIAPEISDEVSWLGPNMTLVAVQVGIWFFLDLFSALIAERDQLIALLIRYFGGKK